MDVLHIVLLALLGVVSYSHGQISGSELEVTARPGDNVTLYCDCKTSSGVHIVWYRNCSHENQPSLVLRYYYQRDFKQYSTLNPIPRFHFVVNDSSNSYDLMIMNVTDSDEGLYYCGTEQTKVYDEDKITHRVEFRYGNVTTRIKINSSPQPWMMALTAAITILSSFLCFTLVCHFCQKTVCIIIIILQTGKLNSSTADGIRMKTCI
ncbi:uncharacterized protein LOC113746519 isoform X2 [Larimichthys crocea]|uniref:uncharacterized protein LOC113746519 isoform X2 n=1 Tax=Larimichthys crocea TaxID=215358 RepID=UPI000F5D5930|nr:uncharacterized protein LOC113746519 isoform X2 [Larimichthys crocea]